MIFPSCFQSFDTHRQHFTNNEGRKDRAFAACVESHNQYILELNSTNKLIEEYHKSAIPWYLEVR